MTRLGSQDPYSAYSIPVNNLDAAIDYCESHGWGYDVMLPRFKYHTRKNYADNFDFKGEPVEEEEED